MYSKSCQTSKMKPFLKIANSFQLLIIFPKSSILNVQPGFAQNSRVYRQFFRGFFRNSFYKNIIKKNKNILMEKRIRKTSPELFIYYLLLPLHKYARGVILCVIYHSCTLSASIFFLSISENNCWEILISPIKKIFDLIQFKF